MTQISEYITDEFGEDYLEKREYKSKSKNAQEAHEAIRPTTVMMDKFNPHDDTHDADHRKLYYLIHNRTVASQMAAAKVQVITNTISLDNSDYKFVSMAKKWSLMDSCGCIRKPEIWKMRMKKTRRVTMKMKHQ